jgi:hypothetical protein
MKLITEAQLNKVILEESERVIREMIDSEEEGILSKLKSFFKKRNRPPLPVDDERLLDALGLYMERYHPGEKHEIVDIEWGYQEEASQDSYRVMASFEDDSRDYPTREYVMWMERKPGRGVPVEGTDPQLYLYGEW